MSQYVAPVYVYYYYYYYYLYAGYLQLHTENIFFFLGHIMLHLFWRYNTFPLQAWTVPEGSRRLTIPDFKTIGT